MSISFSKRDEFVRKPYAEKLINLLVSESKVSPMVISGDLGTGKSEFTLKLIHLLEASEPNYNVIFLDASQASPVNNQLISIVSEMLKLLPESERQPLIETALPALRYSIEIGFKGRGVNPSHSECESAQASNQCRTDIGSDAVLNTVIESLLTEKIEAEKSIKALIEKIVQLIAPREIIIFIDELDHCRPEFSIEMIEVIKQFFQSDKIQFVLVTNLFQLKGNVHQCYGDDFDADYYLDQFINFSFSLSVQFGQGYDLISASRAHFTNLLRDSDLLKETCLHDDDVLGFISYLIRVNSLSLRDVETLIRYFEIANTLSNLLSQNQALGFKLLQVFAVYLFCFEKELSQELFDNHIDVRKIMDSLGKEIVFNLQSTVIDEHNHRPKHSDLLLALISYEATENQALFNFDDDLKQKWQAELQPLFDEAVLDGKESKVAIITNTLKELMLLNVAKE